jgi:diguanylate cyclase (GGDEF)-like protein
VKPSLPLRTSVFLAISLLLLVLLGIAGWFGRDALGGSGAFGLLVAGFVLSILQLGVLLLEQRARQRVESSVGKTARQLERANDDLLRRAQDLSRIGEFSEQLQSCRGTDEVSEVLALAMRGLLPKFDGALYLQTPGRNVLTRTTRWGKPATPMEEMFSPDDCWALRRGSLYPGEGKAPLCRHVGEAVEHYLCAPLRSRESSFGVLHLACREAPTQIERRVAQTIADQVALTITSERLRDTLRVQQVRDPLTGLFNRRYLDESLVREGLRARRRNQSFALLMIDLDHLKRFTDRHGHDVGEVALAQVASQVAQSVRQDDIACRYGGEEFVVIMPDTDLVTAREQADAIRRAVKAAHIDYHGRRLEVITVSIGVAVYPLHGTEPALCLRAADKALNAAKEGGRDRVEVAEAVVEVKAAER